MGIISYRPDIDGLRALAVLLVVFYHAGFDVISGGFIGVDVFFVLSGYLITAIIYRELRETGRLSFKHFYLRRVRRLMPAFIIVTLVTTVAAVVILLPGDLIAYSRSLLAAMLFFANIHFWKSSEGYFEVNTDEFPLLHTWSLSVEEQFYLLWPTALILASRFLNRTSLWILTGLATLLALALSQWGALHSPSAAYYWLPTRAFELLIGAFMAIGQTRLPAVGNALNHVLSVVGGALILGSGLLLDKTMTFPGLNAFWACLGTALLIYSGQHAQGYVNRIIATRPFVVIGLISYSLYLWHWPILAFMNYRLVELTPINGLLAILASLALAYATWVYIERPFRFTYKFGFGQSLARLFVLPCVAALAVLATVSFHEGLPGRFPVIADETDSFPAYASTRNGYCHVTDVADVDYLVREKGLDTDFGNLIDVVERCRLGDVAGKRRALLFGDSTAGFYAPFIDQLSKQSGVALTQLTSGGCMPVLGSSGIGLLPQVCERFSQRYEESVDQYDIAIIAGKWSWDLEQDGVPQRIAELIEFTSKRVSKVIVLAEIPAYKNDIGQCYRRSRHLGVDADQCARDGYKPGYASANQKLAALSTRYTNLEFVDISERICTSDCSPFIDGLFIYFDDDHLNINGAIKVASLYSDSALLEIPVPGP